MANDHLIDLTREPHRGFYDLHQALFHPERLVGPAGVVDAVAVDCYLTGLATPVQIVDPDHEDRPVATLSDADAKHMGEWLHTNLDAIMTAASTAVFDTEVKTGVLSLGDALDEFQQVRGMLTHAAELLQTGGPFTRQRINA